MDGVISQSTQELLRPGPCEDVFYADPKTAKKACWRTTINTRFTSALTNLTQGVSQFTLPPAAGYSDIVVAFQMPTLNTGAAAGLALSRGWGYDLINRISYRIGGSSQYFISGAQNKLLALKNSPDAASRDAILALGGAAVTTAAAFNALGANNYAYVVLSIPGTTPSKSNKSVPIPSDLLSQQIVVTVELNPLSAVFSNNGGSVPAALASGTFQAQQVELTNMADALARRVDMTTHSYSMPVVFTQQETAIGLQAGTGTQSVNLTGFRSGEVRAISLWLTKATDDAATARNGGFWYAPASVQVSYAGQIVMRADAGIAALLNLINQKATSQVAATYLSYGGGAYTATAADSKWVEVPFAQATDEPSYNSVYTSGLEVQNGIIQVQLAATDINGLPVDASGYTLHASYDYNSVIVFSQGTADFAF